MVQAAVDGLRLAVILICFGAANSLASPYRLLRCLPAILYEAGVAVTVSLAFAPEVVMAIAGVRDARRLRGRPTKGLAGLRGMAIPVLESALDRSLQLASSMDARGYGRRVVVPGGTRRLGTMSTASGLLLVLVGVYGLLDTGSLPAVGCRSWPSGPSSWGWAWPSVAGAPTAPAIEPIVWHAAEWVVVASGAVALASLIVAGILAVPGLQLSVNPLRVPEVPLLAMAGVLVGLVPAIAAPAPLVLTDPRRPPASTEEPSVAAAPAAGSRS